MNQENTEVTEETTSEVETQEPEKLVKRNPKKRKDEETTFRYSPARAAEIRQKSAELLKQRKR